MRNSSAISWPHGVISVQSLGGMIGPTSFLLGDGRQFSPFHVPAWANDPEIVAQGGLIAGLRGEWPCVPFGYPMPAESVAKDWRDAMDDSDEVDYVHGYGSNKDWTIETGNSDELRLAINYPEDQDILRLERVIRPDPNAPALNLTLRIYARHDTEVPVALHSCFGIAAPAGSFVLEPGAFAHGMTHPGVVEPGAEAFESNKTFDDLAEVPAFGDGVVDATRLPFNRPIEELLQLNGADGQFALIDSLRGYRMKMTWDAEALPSVLLWYSNGGRSAAPWNGTHYCIGIEPCASPFGLSPQTARRSNPIATGGPPTTVRLTAGKPVEIFYRYEVEPL